MKQRMGRRQIFICSIQCKERDITDLKEKEPALKLIVNLFCALDYDIPSVVVSGMLPSQK